MEDPGSLLSLCFLDLRTQYEAELRTLTNAQRELEHYRRGASPDQRQRLKTVIHKQLEQLLKANRAINDALEHCVRDLARLEDEQMRL